MEEPGMESGDFRAGLNPRVVACLPGASAEAEMAAAGVHSEGIRIMSAKAEFLVLRLDSVPFRLARKVKEILLSTGADAALEESVWAGSDSDGPLVTAATRRQYKDLLGRLEEAGDQGRVMGDALAWCLDAYCRRDFRLRLPSGELALKTGCPVIMGVLNVTPDSFSDGGRFAETGRAVDHALEMAAEGADIIDVGGESTRPGGMAVSDEEEIERTVPVIEAVAKQVSCPISIDTSKAAVARAAFDAGACILNDVTALAQAETAAFAAERDCPVVLMHMKGTPRTMQKSPFYKDLMGEITLFLRHRIDRAVSAGVDREQIVVDPGIGFGKTAEHNVNILRMLKVLASLGRPILVGTSRKSFIGRILDAPPDKRLLGTAASVALAVERGAHVLRVHDVREMREAAAVAASIASGSIRELRE